jgi:hypothetical protein
LTTQREAKKQQKATGTALTVAREPWEDKLRKAILTGRRGIIESQLTAWAAFDTAMGLEVGVSHEFRFNPVEVARAKAVEIKFGKSAAADWPLYRSGKR